MSDLIKELESADQSLEVNAHSYPMVILRDLPRRAIERIRELEAQVAKLTPDIDEGYRLSTKELEHILNTEPAATELGWAAKDLLLAHYELCGMKDLKAENARLKTLLEPLTPKGEEIVNMERALRSLYVQVPEAVADDVSHHVRKAVIWLMDEVIEARKQANEWRGVVRDVKHRNTLGSCQWGICNPVEGNKPDCPWVRAQEG